MRLRILFYTICILIFLLLQSTLLEYVRVYNVIPNLLIVFIILVALLRGNVEGGVVGFFTGLALDMMFGKVLGFYTLLCMYLGVAVGSVNKRLYRDHPLVVIFFTFIFSAAYELLVYILNTFMSGSLDLVYPITGIILPEAIYNSVTAIFIYALLVRTDRFFEEAGKSARKY